MDNYRVHANVLHSLIWATATVLIAIGMSLIWAHTVNLQIAGDVIKAQPVGVKK